MPLWEACVGDYRDALEKEYLGANRIELCTNLYQGGTTPSFGTIKKVVENTSIPVMVMIRPRGGDFSYSPQEIEIMKEDIKIAKQLKASGIVLGVLKNGKIDQEIIKELLSEANNLDTTFHMAFDEIEDKIRGIDQLIGLGINRILTKGSAENAFQGIQNIKRYINHAKGKITIMPGKGITVENRDFIARETGAKELHGTRLV